jgi:serine/threonine protein kinase
MPDPITPPPHTPPEEPGPDSDASPLSRRLQADAPAAPPPPARSPEERRALAEKRVNTQVKSWRLSKLLGAGPVSAAYDATRGTKDAAERAVVRLMIGNVAKHERARSLFLRGSYAANRFNHARVLPVMEDGTDADGTPFVVRPWADAEPLEDVVARGPIDEKRALVIAEQTLDALEMAHAHGILHGAITPGNLLITQRGSVRLCDFATPPGLGARTAEDDMLSLRRRGPFSAPERCGPVVLPASEQSDTYSLAACVYYALTGKPPRGDARTPDALAQTPPIPLRQAAPQVSEALASVIDHALGFDPVFRYESAYAMLGDVRRVMAGRKPKLGEAVAAVPSASMPDMSSISGPPSSRGGRSSGRIRLEKGPVSSAGPAREARRRRETRGNIVLVLAIALLVGVATFVLMRERIADQQAAPAPSSSAP